MDKIFSEFKQYFDAEDKEKAVGYILDKLKGREIDVIELYTYILTPILNNIECDLEDKRICIWKEHIKTAIIRTIVENSYLYVIEKRNQENRPPRGTAVVLCPPDEYHDLGARMVSDFFTVCGYDSVFVGANTPYRDFYNAVSLIKPEIIAISVSNYYHLVATKKMIEELKKAVDYPLKIVVGGYAFHDDRENKLKAMGADFYAGSYEDILDISNSGVQA